MSRLPIGIGAIAFLAVVIGSLVFASDSGVVSASSTAMILVGILGIALTGLAGLLLVRAPWSRWVLGGSVVIATTLASIGGGLWFWIDLAIGSVAIAGLAGPWLVLWVRQQPVAEPLGPVPVTLMASAGFAPIVVGFASYEGVGIPHWTLVFVIIVSAWAYGRGLPFGIWGLRVAVPIFGAVATLQTSSYGNVVIAVGTGMVTILAWLPQARQVTAVITPPLPAPVQRKGVDDASR